MQNQFYQAILVSTVLALLAGCASTSGAPEESPAQKTVAEQPISQETSQAEPASEPEVAPQTTFYFDYDDASLRPDVRQALEAHAARLKENSEVIRIEGYADERGTEAYNKELGQRRADAVRDLLLSLGVSSSQIETVSFGEQHPQAKGNGELIWQQNRRVVLK